MATLFQRHCSDESLISHLDGELPFYRRGSVRRHLETCWQCRLRLSEIETQVLEATRALREDAFPGPQRIAEARLRFLSRADAIADEVFRPRARVPRLAWAAACVALIGVISVWMLPRRQPIAAAEVIRRVEAAEVKAASAPAHQRFRVVARQIRPVPASRESRLELWSEPAAGRFTARFSDSRGVLRHAVWQPAPGRQYVYRASQVVRFSRDEARGRWERSLLSDGLTLEQFEAGLLTWLENRPWRPVSFTSGVALLASSDGAELKAEELPSALRLRARKSAGAVSVEFVLELDRQTYTPRLQSVRYESPARALELQLYSEPVSATVSTVSFEPPAAPVVVANAPAVALPMVNPALLELEVHHALHRLRACLGETIEVSRTPEGTLAVRGAVGSAERKEQVLAALAPLGVSVDIRTAGELLRDIPPESVTAGEPASPPRRRSMKSLADLFGVSEAEAEEFADRALSAGEDLMRDAQALRHLAERLGGRTELENRQARWLVEVMSYDHLRDLEAKVEALRQLLKVTPPAGSEPPPAAWDVELMRIFGLSRSLNERLRALFAGDAAPADIADAIAPLQSALKAACERSLAAHRSTQPF